MDGELLFQNQSPDQEPGATLIEEFLESVFALYGPPDETTVWPSAGAKELGPPHGCFLVGTIDGTPVCCGGIKAIADVDADLGVSAEIKRMYVREQWRGKGISRRLLEALEEQARAIGHTRVRLDTGPKQQAALHLYESAGYQHIADYNGNTFASYWLQKEL